MMKTKLSLAVGDKVDYHDIIGGEITSEGHEVTHIEVRHGDTIAFITNKRGYVSIDALSLSN